MASCVRDLLVLDTNVFMTHLDYIDDLMIVKYDSIILIPWNTIMELEKIKLDRRRIKSYQESRRAAIALKWLNEKKKKEAPT